jgi:hypothetical protein
MRKTMRAAGLALMALGLAGAWGNRALAEGIAAPEDSFASQIVAWMLPPAPAGNVDPGDPQILDRDRQPLGGAPDRGGIWFPILGVLVAGLLWKYLQSPQYKATYERIYGPLSDY